MDLSERFTLRLNEHKENIVNSFHELRTETDFSDVTLVCEDGQIVKAHRIILTACSPFFSSVLKTNKHTHPLIYMRGLKAKYLEAVLDFIYHGEANIHQQDLDGFFAIAEELQLKGLTGYQNEENVESSLVSKVQKPEIKVTEKQQEDQQETQVNIDQNDLLTELKSIVPVVDKTITMTENAPNKELDFKVSSIMKRINDGENARECIVCGKSVKGGPLHMKRHIETHFEGVSYPCNQCEKISRSSNGLRQHTQKLHKQFDS